MPLRLVLTLRLCVKQKLAHSAAYFFTQRRKENQGAKGYLFSKKRIKDGVGLMHLEVIIVFATRPERF